MDHVSEIIASMLAAAPAGLHQLDEPAIAALRPGTRSLLAARQREGQAEYDRFLHIGERTLAPSETDLREWIGGRRILVTGGTGCIGSALLGQLAPLCPASLTSVSRMLAPAWAPVPGTEYLAADVRDAAALTGVIAATRPDVIFHLAAQRDPGLAQTEVHQTVTTNILGTRNVLDAARELGVAEVVLASTGKTLRTYSPDVYAASKRAAEWLCAEYAVSTGGLISAARFTHVVSNSIILRRLLTAHKTGFIRLFGQEILRHGPDVGFYAQSAVESAQLLLRAGLLAAPGEFRVHAITDLGWPVSLLDLTIGVLTRSKSGAVIYFSGHEAGYEGEPFPGLYDPRSAGDVSPLLNAFEAASAAPGGGPCDSFAVRFAPSPAAQQRLAALAQDCAATSSSQVIYIGLDDLSWALADAALAVVDRPVLKRALALTGPHEASLRGEHLRLVGAIRQHAQSPAPAAPSLQRRSREHGTWPAAVPAGSRR